jgi:hypothetical protein
MIEVSNISSSPTLYNVLAGLYFLWCMGPIQNRHMYHLLYMDEYVGESIICFNDIFFVF